MYKQQSAVFMNATDSTDLILINIWAKVHPFSLYEAVSRVSWVSVCGKLKICPVIYLFFPFPHQAFKEMLYAAQDQAPSIEGKETPCLDKQTNISVLAAPCSGPVWPVWASPE